MQPTNSESIDYDIGVQLPFTPTALFSVDNISSTAMPYNTQTEQKKSLSTLARFRGRSFEAAKAVFPIYLASQLSITGCILCFMLLQFLSGYWIV